MSIANPSRRVAVLGAGIAGLAAAHRLLELDPHCDLTVFEAGARPGGVISTLHENGFEIEQSADNFITTVPWAVELCRRVGLGDRLVGTNPAFRRTFVVRRGRLCPLPDGFLMMAPTRLWPLVVTPILSPWGKLRAALEYFIPPRTDLSDESMASFLRRRLGRETFDRLVEPLVSAIYAADLEKLSVAATLSRFREMELEFGSLIRAMRHQMQNRPKTRTTSESGARYSMFVTLRDGLSSLIDALVQRLPHGVLRLNAPVQTIERCPAGWRVSAATEDSFAKDFSALIVATPSPVAARLLRPIDALLADQLTAIERSGTAIVSVAYAADQIAHPIDGMGAVVPACERSPILALSFSSRKYPHRAPAGMELLRAFVGGARRPDLAAMPDEPLQSMVVDELAKLLQIRGRPSYCQIARWPDTMPQYYVGHLDRVAQIEARTARWPGLAMAGNAYRGVGIPDCIHGGQRAAENIVEQRADRA
ncbi:MAG: protoporphyrinogen oxidase [Planctomycetaceae bacterium]|nr:protoporphyrinogen oxidase [Planctomycetaceae bacterium]